MSRTALLVACTVTFIVGMFLIGLVIKYLVANIGWWVAWPWLAVCLFIGYLIERHEKRKRSAPHNLDGPRSPGEWS